MKQKYYYFLAHPDTDSAWYLSSLCGGCGVLGVSRDRHAPRLCISRGKVQRGSVSVSKLTSKVIRAVEGEELDVEPPRKLLNINENLLQVNYYFIGLI